MHVIKLNGYNATTENGEKLELGTFDNFELVCYTTIKRGDTRWIFS